MFILVCLKNIHYKDWNYKHKSFRITLLLRLLPNCSNMKKGSVEYFLKIDFCSCCWTSGVLQIWRMERQSSGKCPCFFALYASSLWLRDEMQLFSLRHGIYPVPGNIVYLCCWHISLGNEDVLLDSHFVLEIVRCCSLELWVMSYESSVLLAEHTFLKVSIICCLITLN